MEGEQLLAKIGKLQMQVKFNKSFDYNTLSFVVFLISERSKLNLTEWKGEDRVFQIHEYMLYHGTDAMSLTSPPSICTYICICLVLIFYPGAEYRVSLKQCSSHSDVHIVTRYVH